MSFYHHVYFYPTESSNPSDQAELIGMCQSLLATIPGVTSLALGTPAGTDRPVVDNDYIVALLLEFPNAEAEKEYQVHPQHVQFVAESRRLWSTVKVFDSNGV